MSDIKIRKVYLLRRTDKPDDETDIYVGSTSRTLRKRLWNHRSDALRTRNKNNKLYKKMREVGLDNWEMVPLLSFACDRKTILEFEKEWCNALNSDLNTNSPFPGFKNKKEYRANYRESNKETIKQQKAEYYKLNKQNKTHYCNVCEKFFGHNGDLKKHFESLKHLYAYMNSVD